MDARTIFGREPVVLVSLVESAIVLASLLVLHWSSEQISAVMLVVVTVFGVYTAWATKDTLLSAALAVVKAVVVLLAGFGFNLDPNTLVAVLTFLTLVLGLFLRTQTSPAGPVSPPVVPTTVGA